MFHQADAATIPHDPTPLAEVMRAEANHRIANNLALVAGLLGLQARQLGKRESAISPREAKVALLEACAKVAAAGDLHRILTTCVDAEVELDAYLERIAQGAIDVMTDPGEVELRMSFRSRCRVASDLGLKFGLVIGELIINAIKYAHPATTSRGLIEIGCSADGGGAVTVWVSDDGVGLPESFDPKRSGGLGMQTLHLIAQDLGAELTFDDSELGLTVRMRAPSVVAGSNRLELV